eukprot:979935-Rhodomonas_salina.1
MPPKRPSFSVDTIMIAVLNQVRVGSAPRIALVGARKFRVPDSLCERLYNLHVAKAAVGHDRRALPPENARPAISNAFNPSPTCVCVLRGSSCCLRSSSVCARGPAFWNKSPQTKTRLRAAFKFAMGIAWSQATSATPVEVGAVLFDVPAMLPRAQLS